MKKNWFKRFLCHFIPFPKLRRKIRKSLNERLILSHFAENILAKREFLKASQEKIQQLILGSSHAEYGGFPQVFSLPTFNLGMISQDLYSSYQLLAMWKNKLPNLKRVIFFSSVFTPGGCLIKTKEAFRSVMMECIFGIPLQGELEVLNDEEVRKIKEICSSIKNCSKEIDKNGFNWNVVPIKIEVNERVLTHLRENKRQPNQLEYFRKMFSVFPDIVVVIPPVRKDYQEALPLESELFLYLDQLRAEGINFQTLNFYADQDFNDDDFSDTDHLNLQGAKKLSCKIEEFLA